MADADTVWSAVKARYDTSGLLQLTNIRDRAAIAIDDDVGTAAAQTVLSLWPSYAEEAFDVADLLHIEVAVFGTIAALWRRGGAAQSIAKVEWDEVFGAEGMLARVRRTGARGRQGPSSNSGVTTSRENANGPVRGWSDPASLPVSWLPQSPGIVSD